MQQLTRKQAREKVEKKSTIKSTYFGREAATKQARKYGRKVATQQAITYEKFFARMLAVEYAHKVPQKQAGKHKRKSSKELGNIKCKETRKNYAGMYARKVASNQVREY